MIWERPSSAKPWSPQGFERYLEHYPATLWSVPPAQLDRTRAFLALWWAAERRVLPTDVAVVLTPGLFAEWLPTCFRAARRAFEADGHRVLQTPVRTSRGIRAQAGMLSERILAWLNPGERFVWCTHSRGGLDAFWALAHGSELARRCAAVVAVQPPVGPSWIADRWRGTGSAHGSRAAGDRAAPGGTTPDRTIGDRCMGLLLRRRLFRDGVRDICTDRDRAVADWLAKFSPPVPALHAVSWSLTPTSWLDSYHARLRALRPGHAHDGQFYLCDQRLPATPVVTLPALDHAQPVLGGLGLDTARLWRTLVACAWQDASETQTR